MVREGNISQFEDGILVTRLAFITKELRLLFEMNIDEMKNDY